VGRARSKGFDQGWLKFTSFKFVDPFNNEFYFQTRIEEMRLCSTRACEHLAEMFGAQGDYQCSILRIWARCEAARCGNLEKFRQLWTDIMSFEQMGHSATYWLEYISVERYFDFLEVICQC
jgi:hypothetical protein